MKPEWLKVKASVQSERINFSKQLSSCGIHTICTEGDCPNCLECFGNKVATFMIMGNVCTRNCGFCNVKHGKPKAIEQDEIQKIISICKKVALKYVVITSVTRDDLLDGGASYYAKTVNSLKTALPQIGIEVLIPDFKGDKKAIQTVVQARPNVIGHNIEVIPRLYDIARAQASYERSLQVLSMLKTFDQNVYSKSSIMMGLGETKEEVISVFKDLRAVGCDALTIGQYLAPSSKHIDVVEYVHPEQFDRYKQCAYELGFLNVESGPFVRSSYHAADFGMSIKV
ncbi:lipoic acid synthetase [Ruminiclostridium sufflavum DSM 19573]|uniref:Lipoyl synthase n=1 Tax=Ruminiclostridium sufflavum DSM 19573 TaxID=1121337 RepID=A0A318XSU7_9FIRM|nr:lipoyl synthase [Ruminiclostridium sufflavum]PYG84954.1 lipoic acid synthetase [Ruminiclostridium sufflavum DSM 19573]